MRCISGEKLLPVLKRLGPPLAAFTALEGDGEGIVAGVERWMLRRCGVRARGPWRSFVGMRLKTAGSVSTGLRLDRAFAARSPCRHGQVQRALARRRAGV